MTGHFALTPVSTGGSTFEPVTLEEAKRSLRIDPTVTDDDDDIARLIRTARTKIENAYRQIIPRREFDFFLDASPCDRVIRLPFGPLASVTSIVGFDRDHVETTVSSSAYYADTASLAGRIVLNSDASWPSNLRDANGIRCRVILGHSTSAAGVPDPMRDAVLQLVAFLYEHRGEGAGAFAMPPQVDELMAEYYIPEVV